MHHKSIGFIGGGRITRIILEGWSRAGKMPADVAVSDPNAETWVKLKARFASAVVTEDNKQTAARDIVFLAVHPPAVAETAGLVKGSLKPGSVVVSLAPKFTIAKLAGLLGGFNRLARVIPNAPSLIGRGFNPVAFAPGLPAGDKAELGALLTPLGEAETAAALKRMVDGTAATLLESGLSPAEVMDLVPVKPLAEMEAQVSEMYRTRLSGIYQKIKP